MKKKKTGQTTTGDIKHLRVAKIESVSPKMIRVVNAGFALGLLFCLAGAAPANEECDKLKCPGPIKFYKDISCEPVYAKQDDCCPVRYNCSSLSYKPESSCVLHGKAYHIWVDNLEPENHECNEACSCNIYSSGGVFECYTKKDDLPRTDPGCYRNRNATSCQAGPQICPEKPEDIPTCNVDGVVYKAGEAFSPAGDPVRRCYCGPGYTGQNVEPFCKKDHCGNELYERLRLNDRCGPAYKPNQSMQTDCNYGFVCENETDRVVKGEHDESTPVPDDMKCIYGKLTLNVGDKIVRGADSPPSKECLCEVPPFVTCRTSTPDFVRGGSRRKLDSFIIFG